MPGPWPLVTALTCTLYRLLKYNIAIVYYLVDRNSFRKWCRWRQNLSPSGRELGLLMVSYSRWKSSNHLRIRSFGYKVISVQTQSEITQKLRLVSGFETTGNLLFFLRQASFVSLVFSEAPTTMRSHQSKGRAKADCVMIAWFARFTSVRRAVYPIIIRKTACIQSWASPALRTDKFSKLWVFLKQEKN